MTKTNLVKMNKAKATNTAADMYDLVMKSIKTVGAKTYAYIPVNLLFVDDTFQRDVNSMKFKKKVRQLSDKWDINKMDALRVVPHPEEYVFSVFDGSHRLAAATRNGERGLECEIIMGLSDDPKERRTQEATLFATQGDEIDTLAPVEKHKANVLRGVKEYCIIDEITRKYRIPLKTNPSHGRVKIGHLAGYTESLRIAKSCGKEMVDNIFYILCEARWNIARNGLSANAINSIFNVLKLHPDNTEDIIKKKPFHSSSKLNQKSFLHQQWTNIQKEVKENV